MRTTVSLAPDVEVRLRAIARERGITFKEAMDIALRRGLAGEEPRRAETYRVEPRSLGLRPGVDLTKGLRLAAELEDEAIVRKLEIRK